MKALYFNGLFIEMYSTNEDALFYYMILKDGNIDQNICIRKLSKNWLC